MTLTATLHDTSDARRPAVPVEAMLQNIASAAWARGAVISTTFKPIPPADLMRALRGAWTKVQGEEGRTARVAAIAQSIHLRLQYEGPVQVNPTSFGVLNSFAGIATASKKGRAKK